MKARSSALYVVVVLILTLVASILIQQPKDCDGIKGRNLQVQGGGCTNRCFGFTIFPFLGNCVCADHFCDPTAAWDFSRVGTGLDILLIWMPKCQPNPAPTAPVTAAPVAPPVTPAPVISPTTSAPVTLAPVTSAPVTPAPAVVGGWYLGEPGATCLETCTDSLPCVIEAHELVTTDDALEYVRTHLENSDELDCTNEGSSGEVDPSYFDGDSVCTIYGGASTCDADPDAEQQRFCCCGTNVAACPVSE